MKPRIPHPDNLLGREYKYIALTKCQYACVDASLFEWVSVIPWQAHWGRKSWYAYHSVKHGNGRFLHNEIFGALGIEIPRGYTVDHRNGDTLDCRFANLRFGTHQDQKRNQRRRIDNSTGYIGVVWHGIAAKWHARAKVAGKNFHLGLFTDPIQAALARDEFVKEHFGEFAVLNFPNAA